MQEGPTTRTIIETRCYMCKYHSRRMETFAVLFPDGAMLNFVANSMKELKEFENKLNFYAPAY